MAILTYNKPVAFIVTGLFGHVAFNRLEPRGKVPILSLLLVPPLVPILLLPFDKFILPTVLVSYGLYFGILICSVVAYRLSPFHPLAGYPGPVLARVTRFWAYSVVETGQQFRYYKTLHDRYGTHVRTGPNHLSIRDSAAVSAVMGVKGFPRGSRYDIVNPAGTTGSLITILDPHEHSQRRRLWDRSLNPNAVQGYLDVLSDRISQLVHAIETQSGETDLSFWFSCFSFDFMGDLAFDGAFKTMDRESSQENFMKVLREGVKFQERAGTIPWVKPFRSLVPGFGYLRELQTFGKASVLARKANGSKRKDIFYYLLDEEGTGSGAPSVPTLIVESTLAIIAGSDTTGTTLSNLFFYLISHPDVFARLRAEVDATFPVGADIFDPAIVGELPLLNAVINETLRLQPAVPNGVQRVVPATKGGAIVAGRWVPSSTTVQVPIYSLHRDPRYFYPDPDSFRPDRWIEPLKGDGKFDLTAYLPFSFGPMNCAGKYLALQELRMVVCALVQKFDFTFVPGWETGEWERELLDYFVLAKGKMPVLVKARK